MPYSPNGYQCFEKIIFCIPNLIEFVMRYDKEDPTCSVGQRVVCL